MPLFCYAVYSVLSSFAIILLRKRELIALLKLSSCCHNHVAVSVLYLFLMRAVGMYAVGDCSISRSFLHCYDLGTIPSQNVVTFSARL